MVQALIESNPSLQRGGAHTQIQTSLLQILALHDLGFKMQEPMSMRFAYEKVACGIIG